MISEIFVRHAWLWPLVWQSTLCLAAGLGGSFLLRRHAVRAHQALLLSLIAAVLIPALSQVVKRNQWGLLAAERAVAPPEPRPIPATTDWLIPDRPIVTEPARVPLPAKEPEPVPVPVKPRFEWTRAILPAWLVVSAILFLRLAIQFLLGRRLAKHAEAIDDAAIHQLITTAKDKLEVRTDVEVRVSTRMRSPVIWCWGRCPILLIPSAPRRDCEQLDWLSILCHELAHAKRRDHLSGLFAELMTCALPWQPLLWWARHRLSALSEEACDDWVIASGQRATRYARSLLGLTPQGQAALLPGVVTSRRGLAFRVRRILEDGCGNPRPGVCWSLAAIALAGSLAVGVAFAQTRPASPLPTEVKPSASSRERLNKILDAMSYHDRAVMPIALHSVIDMYNLDLPADSQHNQTYVFEQRLDGKRLDSLMNAYWLQDGESRHRQENRSVFTGEQFLYRQQMEGQSLVSPILESKGEATRIMGYDFMWGCTLFGYLPGDEVPVATLLRNTADVVLHDRQEEVQGFACDVIEGTTDHGTYKLWVDPAHDYRIRRALVDKGANDLFHGKPVSTPRPQGLQDQTSASIHLEISDVTIEDLGGHFIPTAESVTTTTRNTAGRESHGKTVVKRSQIDLKPDFEKLGAFVMDGIPEGTAVWNSDPNDHTYAYEWHNGKAVSVAPEGGTLVGRIQFAGHKDLGTVLTGQRSFRACLTSEALEEKATHYLTLTPEKNGAFYVKDIPPGWYRLKLSLTDLFVEKVSGGGLLPHFNVIAEAEREFSIPEGQEAARKTADLGVIEMTLPDTTGPSGDTDEHGGADASPPEVSDRPGRTAENKTPLSAQTAPGDWPDSIVSAGMVRLRLTDPDGRPVVGATVGGYAQVSGETPVSQSTVGPAQTSDERGEVVFDIAGISRRKMVSPNDVEEMRTKKLPQGAVYLLQKERNLGAVYGLTNANAGQSFDVRLSPLCHVQGTVSCPGLPATMQVREIDGEVQWQKIRVAQHSGRTRELDFPLPPGEYVLILHGVAHESVDWSGADASTRREEHPFTIRAGVRDLDLGDITLRPTKLATLVGQLAPELGPIKAWKNGPPVTLAQLRGQVVLLFFAEHVSAQEIAALARLQDTFGNQGLTILALFNCTSVEEWEQKWPRYDPKYGQMEKVPFRLALDGGEPTRNEATGQMRPGATFGKYDAFGSTMVLIDQAGKIAGEYPHGEGTEIIRWMLAARQRSAATTWRQRFDDVYRLADGEILKRIAPPFLPERAARFRNELGSQSKAIPRDPDQIVFHWDGKLKMHGLGVGQVNSLGYILANVLRFKRYEYDGPKPLLDLELAGDWIVRDETSPESKLRALEELVARDLGRKIRFEQRPVERETIIATGEFRFHPPAAAEDDTAVYLSAVETGPDEKALPGMAQSLSEFLQMVGNLVNMPALNRTGQNRPIRIPYVQHRSAIGLQEIRDKQEKLRQVKVLLDRVTAQTELQFEIRQESVPVWFVTE